MQNLFQSLIVLISRKQTKPYIIYAQMGFSTIQL